MEEEMHLVPDTYTLDYLHISSGTTVVPTATIGLRKEGKLLEEAACGNGPVDAICKAVDKITKIQCTMISWGISAITAGKGRPGRCDPENYQGRPENLYRPGDQHGYTGSQRQGLYQGC